MVSTDCRVTRGRARQEKGPRVWHLSETETETDCGNFTSLYREEKPSELCNEVSSMRESIYNDQLIIIIILVCMFGNGRT